MRNRKKKPSDTNKSQDTTGNGTDENRYAWCKRVFDSFERKGAAKYPRELLEMENGPQGPFNALGKVVLQAMPLVKIRSLQKGITPRDLGLFLGQQVANFYELGEVFRRAKSVKPGQAALLVQTLRENSERPGAASTLLALELLGQTLPGLPAICKHFETRLYKAFKAALEQESLEDAASFFEGFATGLKKPGIHEGRPVGETTATPIYQQIFLHWREVQRLKRFSELHTLLLRNGVSKSVLGKPKRLEKICERLGLSFRTRGRPRKDSDTRAR